MYPQRELSRLAAHKIALRRSIARHRADCCDAAAGVMQPVEWLDRALAVWRRLSPYARFAAVPLGLLIQRTVRPRPKILSSLVRWTPLALVAVRGLSSALRSRSGPVPPSRRRD